MVRHIRRDYRSDCGCVRNREQNATSGGVLKVSPLEMRLVLADWVGIQHTWLRRAIGFRTLPWPVSHLPLPWLRGRPHMRPVVAPDGPGGVESSIERQSSKAYRRSRVRYEMLR